MLQDEHPNIFRYSKTEAFLNFQLSEVQDRI
jgi:hypothetical protein